MHIFSSFDTKFKQQRLSFYKEKYGADKIVLISKSFLFLVTKVIIPFFLLLAAMVALIFLLFAQLSQEYALMSLVFMTVVYGLANVSVIKYLVDYTMDFCIVTPEEVFLVRQEGLLCRTDITLETAKIKSIYVNKTTLWDSLFNEGVLDFMGEGDERSGEISFDYVYSPEKIKDRIEGVIMSSHHG